MKNLKNISIRWKLVLMIMAGSLITLILGLLLNILFEKKRYESNLMDEYYTHAVIIGQWIAEPLSKGNLAGVNEILNQYGKIEDISNIIVYDKENLFITGFYHYYSDTIHKNISTDSFKRYVNNVAHIHTPITINEKQLGTLCFTAPSSHLKNIFFTSFRLFLLFIIPVFVIMYLIAMWMQRYISAPLINLAHVTEKTAREHDYSIQINKSSEDEIGKLHDAFNHLLREVQRYETNMRVSTARLQKEKRKAIESDNLKTAFLGNMSHEIRTPMNAIIGFTHLFNRENLSIEKKKEFASYIQKSSDSLAQLIDDIIDLSRMESGELSLRKKHFSIVSLMEKAKEISLLECKFAKKDQLELIFSFDERYAEMHMYNDPVRLKQILLNLLSNAIKFTEKGSVNFGFNVYNTQEIIFFVKDTGIGIKKDLKHDIFERFVKLENMKDHTLYRGAGLGLAISKNLVNLMKGRIWYEPGPAGGTSFYFTVPLSDKVIFNKESAKTDGSTIDNLNLKSWKDKVLLVAEDEESNFILIDEIMRPAEIKILRARNGKEAVELFRIHPHVDLVLMDIKMPVMDGLEAATAIRQINPKQVIIAQTAFALKDEQEKFKRAGMDDYIAKPIMPDELIQLIDKYLS